MARRTFLALQAAALIVQSAARSASCRRVFVRNRAAAVTVQSLWRGCCARAMLKRRKVRHSRTGIMMGMSAFNLGRGRELRVLPTSYHNES